MKQPLVERFQQLAGIKPLYTEQLGPRMSNPRPTGPSDPRSSKDIEFDNAQAMDRLTPDDQDKLGKIQQMMRGEKQETKWEFFDLKFGWMTELPEDIKVTVPDLYGPSLGEPAQKVNKKFPSGTTNIGYTLRGWFDEFEKKYPDALFYVDEQNNTVEVADTREEGINLKWFEDVEESESKRFDNSPKPGSWRKSDNMGNKTDPWS